MRLFFSLLCISFISSGVFSQQPFWTANVEQSPPHKTPQQIQQELNIAEAEFKKAQEMFNPWYTGPLQTPSATMVPPGYMNSQPYLTFTDTYAAFNKERSSRKLKNSRLQLSPSGGPVLQIGVTPSTDVTLSASAAWNWQNGSSGGGYGDTSLTMGFLISRESLYVPKAKFTVKETFPTGRYQHLSHNGLGLDATGGGSYQTQFGLAFGKLLFWSYKHPLNLRLFFSYQVATPVKVRGFNSYGGGFGTKARVHPGNTFTADFGAEYSLTQAWALALDVVYTAQNETTFSGKQGTTATGTPAPLGGGYNDNLSLCPALEYNFNDHSGFVGGSQFSVYGRNSGNFVSGIISFYYYFKVT